MKGVFACLCLATLAGCGGDEKVTVGEPGQQGVYRKNIANAESKAGLATDRVRSGEQDVYGK